MIEPINTQQRDAVIALTEQYRARAALLLACELERITVVFDLKGRAAGMYCVRQDRRWIRYNPYLFAKYYSDNLAQTVPHEVAHYAIDQVYGQPNVRPHGKEWQTLMLALGASPERTCQYDLQGVPVRRQQTHRYSCACSEYELSQRRHNRIVREGVSYFCRKCKQALQQQ